MHTLVPGADGTVLFSAGSDSVVQMWDLRNPRKPAIELEKQTFGKVRINSLDLGKLREQSQQGFDTVAAGFSDGAVCMWDVRKKSFLKMYLHHFT